MEPRVSQEIVDNIIGNININEKQNLRRLSLVSRSFLYPSRKRLFAKIALAHREQSQGLLSVLAQHPYIQSSVRHLEIHYPSSFRCLPWYSEPTKFQPNDEPTLLSLLRLPLLSLRTLVFDSASYCHWPKLSSDLRDALSDVIHSPSLTSLELCRAVRVPISLFLGLKGVRTLDLYDVHLSDADDDGVSPIASQAVNEVKTSAHNGTPIECFTLRLPQASGLWLCFQLITP